MFGHALFEIADGLSERDLHLLGNSGADWYG
jgi:hypothetical protein